MNPSTIAHIAIALFVLLGVVLFLFLGCTIKVEPLAKPKPKIVYRSSHHSTHKKTQHHTTPRPLLQPEPGTTKLIEPQPMPHPTSPHE
jgi:hypothetical protein